MESYRELVVWQKSCALALTVYRATGSFPRSETFGMTSQLRRAAVSVPTNIAEGYCRQTRADYLRFLSIAQGSVGEVETLLYLCRGLSYLDETQAQELTGLATEVSRMLTRLTQRLRASAPASRPLAPGP